MKFLSIENGIICQGSEPIILRGMGLGGWLLPEGYMWKFYTKCDRPRRIEALIEKLCGPEYAKAFWKRYYGSYITEKDIAWIAGQGLNSVRIALNARHLFFIDSRGNIQFEPDTLWYVDQCVRWCKKYEIYLFLDMHGAPGGQTGQNIDDSEKDIPELFTDEKNQDALVEMWRLLARRYESEPTVGGYDLLNEPLPEWNSQYNHLLLPLYRRLIKAIREIDTRHVIILEGVHWATDFSVFDGFTKEEAADNIVLQFHKYWSNPDEESITQFIKVGKRLNVPLWMGEGGENNCQWYTYAFPMYERLGIGWCFWSYKKMEIPNSPVTFAQPMQWNKIINYLDGKEQPDVTVAQEIFDDFLSCVEHGEYHIEVINALLRRPPVEIPAAAYDEECIISERREGAHFRASSRATLCFFDGHTGEVDWSKVGGEPQPMEQCILLCLQKGDSVGYRIEAETAEKIVVNVVSKDAGTLRIRDVAAETNKEYVIDMPEDKTIWITCEDNEVRIDHLMISIN